MSALAVLCAADEEQEAGCTCVMPRGCFNSRLKLQSIKVVEEVVMMDVIMCNEYKAEKDKYIEDNCN